MKPKVSIIMGVYNGEKTLSRALDSLLDQDYKNWNCIICDDGSSDHTIDVLKQYKIRYPKHFVIIKNKKNSGLAYTLNHCLKYADGKYIARMDDDDVSLPSRLSKEVEFLESHSEYAFTGCAVERFDENGVWKRCSTVVNPNKKVFLKSSGFVHPTILIRKDAIMRANGYDDVWYTNRCEDYDLWMRLYAMGYKGHNIEEILFQYYEGKNSVSKKKYKYRICETVMRAKGFKNLKLYPIGFIFVIKPLIVGLIPGSVLKKIHNR